MSLSPTGALSYRWLDSNYQGKSYLPITDAPLQGRNSSGNGGGNSEKQKSHVCMYVSLPDVIKAIHIICLLLFQPLTLTGQGTLTSGLMVTKWEEGEGAKPLTETETEKRI